VGRSRRSGPNCLEPNESTQRDRVLLQRIARGDGQALGQLYDGHARRLAVLAQRFLFDTAAVEDVVHDVFIEVWEHAGDYDPARGSVGAWLTMRLRSRCLDRLRRHQVRRTARDAVRHETAPQAPPMPLDDGGRLSAALDVLNDGEKSVVEALFFSDLGSSEAAALLNLPIGTVKSRVRTALDKIRRALRIEVAP
jgi:RNA polymerase sigma-70 factor (ECF subfamily)